MYKLTATLFALSALVLIVQGGSIPLANSYYSEETKAINTVDLQKLNESGILSIINGFINSDLFEKILIMREELIALAEMLKPLAKTFILPMILPWGVGAICQLTPLCSLSESFPNSLTKVIEEKIINMARLFMSTEDLDYVLKTVKATINQYKTA